MARIEVEQARLTIRNRTLFSGVSVHLRTEEPVVIVGPSGAGKTSLLRSIMGLVSLTSGRVQVDGVAIDALSQSQRAGYFAWLPQQPTVAHGMTSTEYLMGSRFRFPESRSMSRLRIRNALSACDVGTLAERSVRNLSGGELQRVLLAGCFAQESRWLLLDEPANHLDPGLTQALMKMVADRHREGLGLLLVTHQLDMLGPLQRMTGVPVRVIGIRCGEVRMDTHSDRDLAAPFSDLYGFPMKSLLVDGDYHYFSGAG